jgi:HlyD family secretion protein
MVSKLNIRWVVIAGLAIVAAAILAVLFTPRPLPVEAAAIRRGPIAETVSDQGQARVRRAYVVSAPVSGRLERLPVEVGDAVTAGRTVVATVRPAQSAFLDPRTQAQAVASVAAARSALAQAQAQRQQVNAEAVRSAGEYARLSPLGRNGFVSRQSLDNARAAADAAREAVLAADAAVRARRADLAAAQSAFTGPEAAGKGLISITSPTSGVVTRLVQQSERDVAAGAPLVEVGATQGLEAQIEFLSQDAVKIRPGDRAAIYNWGGAADIPAQVRLVEPQGFTKVSALGVEEQRTLVMLQFTGPASGWAGLAPGYRVWGRVILRETPSAVVAPVGALVRDKGGWAVFRIEQGRARLRPVKVGAITDADAEILGGVGVGDTVVIFPSDQVRDGIRVHARASN